MSNDDQQGLDDITVKLDGMSLPNDAPAITRYEYASLPSKRHIRVLHLLPRPEVDFPSPFWLDPETIHCSIKTLSLDDKPEFDALSYTWGNPITVYENEEQAKEGASIFEKPLEIFCDGKLLKVTVNLYDALLAIRRIPRDVGYPDIAERERADYLWIDAICINQNDIAERNTQVAIMDQIYSGAKITIVWLGRDDVFARPATQVFQAISRIPDDVILSMKHQNGIQLGSRDYASLGIRKIEEVEWLSVYAFLNRNWFRRAWVLQELALSHQICVLTGLVMMNWAPIVTSCRTLELSKWYGSIAHTAECVMEGRSRSATIKRDKIFNPARAVYGVTEVRAGLGIEDKALKLTEHCKALDLTGLMQLFRYSSSTEPRDKIYALCGLIPKDGPEAQQNVQKIVPDYNKAIELVYTEAARYQMGWSNGLGFLGHVQDAAHTQIDDLPSWVPDYSVMLIPNSLSEPTVNHSASNPVGVSPFFASGNLEFTTPILPQPSPNLSVRGILCDVIADTGDFGQSHDLMDIIQLLSDLPHVYWDDALQSARRSGEDDGQGLSLTIEEGYVKVSGSSPDDDPSENQDGDTTSQPITRSRDSLPRVQTFFEVLWRTLIADCWDGQHPAPVEAGYAFVDSLMKDIQHLFYASMGNMSEEVADNNAKFKDQQTQKLSVLKTLATCEFGGFTSISWSDDAPDKRTLSSNKDSTFVEMPEEVMEKMLTRFLPKFDDAMDIIFRELKNPLTALWSVRFSQVMPGRKLFRTKHNRFLGTGAESLQIGDVVCVLAGGSVPYLIRPIDGGRDNRFRFVGEAYVHGIMHGQVEMGIMSDGIPVTAVACLVSFEEKTGLIYSRCLHPICLIAHFRWGYPGKHNRHPTALIRILKPTFAYFYTLIETILEHHPEVELPDESSSASMVVERTGHWPPVGPLIILFTPPASCLSHLYGGGAIVTLGLFSQQSECYPSSYWPEYWNGVGYYSPGVCPSGYISACGRKSVDTSGYTVGPEPLQGETVVECCPSYYVCHDSLEYYCSSSIASLTTATSISNTNTITVGTDATPFAFGIQVRYQKSDLLVLGFATPASTTSPVNSYTGIPSAPGKEGTTTAPTYSTLGPSATGYTNTYTTIPLTYTPPPSVPGLPTGTKIAIGVVAILLILILFAAGALVFKRRKKNSRQGGGDFDGNLPVLQENHDASGKEVVNHHTRAILVNAIDAEISKEPMAIVAERKEVGEARSPSVSIAPSYSVPILGVVEKETSPPMQLPTNVTHSPAPHYNA
ncbi:heterokaryon incompatibility protein-domain-containing protein [Halenospora varia]|nr:heterokaryon incompatibility protein-domain-containing protein [Halenospora varia]